MIDALLGIDFPGRDELRTQAADCRVEQIDDNGSLAITAAGPASTSVERVPVEAQAIDDDGIFIHILLHVVGGRLHELEIYRDDSKPLVRRPDPSEWDIFALPGEPTQ